MLADQGQIEQILVNLAVNARDAMPSGGTLTIETGNTYVDEAYAASRAICQPGNYACMKVSDTGTGMPREIIDRAFEPFFTTKAKAREPASGLATVYGIVNAGRRHGADLLRTRAGHHRHRAAARYRPSASPRTRHRASGSAVGGEVVLLVEDEAAVREMTRRILDRNGYRVLAAASGLEAIDVVTGQNGHIDVLLTDVVMPKMLGKEVADRVTDLQPGVRVLFMSGYTQGLLSAQGVLEPGLNLIEKPFSEASLLAKLREVLAAGN